MDDRHFPYIKHLEKEKKKESKRGREGKKQKTNVVCNTSIEENAPTRSNVF